MEEVKSDADMQAQYIPRNPVSRVIQCAAVASENEVGQGWLGFVWFGHHWSGFVMVDLRLSWLFKG